MKMAKWLSASVVLAFGYSSAAQSILYVPSSQRLAVEGAHPFEIFIPGVWSQNDPSVLGAATFGDTFMDMQITCRGSVPVGETASFRFSPSICFELTSPAWVALQGNFGVLGLLGPAPDAQSCGGATGISAPFVTELPAGRYQLQGNVQTAFTAYFPSQNAYQFGPYRFHLESMPGPCVTPETIVQRVSVAFCRGATVALHAEMQSSPQGTLRYQWWRGNVNNPLVGENADSLQIPNLQEASEGVYGCTVTNLCGTIGVANHAVHLCAVDTTCNGTVDIADVFAFLSDWFVSAPSADFNHFNGITVADIFDFLSSWFLGCS